MASDGEVQKTLQEQALKLKMLLKNIFESIQKIEVDWLDILVSTVISTVLALFLALYFERRQKISNKNRSGSFYHKESKAIIDEYSNGFGWKTYTIRVSSSSLEPAKELSIEDFQKLVKADQLVRRGLV